MESLSNSNATRVGPVYAAYFVKQHRRVLPGWQSDHVQHLGLDVLGFVRR